MNKFIFLGIFFLGGTLFAATDALPSSTVKETTVIKEHSVSSIGSNATIKVVDNVKFGKILTDSKGMTLYKFTDDKSGVSACYDKCAVEWPPVLVSDGKPVLDSGVLGNLSTVKRNDGTTQVTYNGMPLYTYFKDKKVGDVNGQKVDGKWFVINPSGK